MPAKKKRPVEEDEEAPVPEKKVKPSKKKASKVDPAEKGKKKKKKADGSDSEEEKIPATGNTFDPPPLRFLPKGTDTGAIDLKRINVRHEGQSGGLGGPVVYWMSRDQRAEDNWALVYAQHLGKNNVVVLFNVVNTFLGAPYRHFDFMLKGLEEVEKDLRAKNIPFFVTCGDSASNVAAFSNWVKASAVVGDFSPLHTANSWKQGVIDKLDSKVPFYEVDAHNVVPAWVASPKQEWSAATFRKKIWQHIPSYLVAIPALDPVKNAYVPPSASPASLAPVMGGSGSAPQVDWKFVRSTLKCDMDILMHSHIQPGRLAAEATLTSFLTNKLKTYATARNVPASNHLSQLSPYFHYGTLSVQKAAFEASRYKSKYHEGFSSFFEESVVRRELSDNYCYYNPFHDQYKGLPPWAKITHQEHAKDKREYIYSRQQLEKAQTHDNLWNACQNEMVWGGKMHGYVRMYWAKKILEWTPSAQDAFATAVYLNDKYSLDGRDPNGFVGCAWAIGGVHDRAWGPVRKVFGKIRYMNYDGCKRKFDISSYIARVAKLKLK